MEKTELPYKNIDEYIAQCPEETRERLQTLREAIHGAVPEPLEEKISWGMPTFVLHGNLIHFALAKKHIGLFPGANAVDAFAARLTDYDATKGTVRLPHAQPLPLPLIREIVAFCAAEKQRAFAAKTEGQKKA